MEKNECCLNDPEVCEIEVCKNQCRYYCPQIKKKLCFNCKMLVMNNYECFIIDQNPEEAKQAIKNMEEVFKVITLNYNSRCMKDIFSNFLDDLKIFQDRLHEIKLHLDECIDSKRLEKFSYIQNKVCNLYKELNQSEVMNNYKTAMIITDSNFDFDTNSLSKSLVIEFKDFIKDIDNVNTKIFENRKEREANNLKNQLNKNKKKQRAIKSQTFQQNNKNNKIEESKHNTAHCTQTIKMDANKKNNEKSIDNSNSNSSN